MSSIFSVVIALVVFSILVLVHEAGHFFVAKKSGVLVEEFSIGMGPLLCSKTIGDTQYSIRALPLGGFCRMLGENGEEEDSRAFHKKNVWARIAIIFMGPMMNFVLGLLLIFFVNATATAITFPEVTAVLPETNAAQAGLMPGDKIVSVNRQSVGTYGELYLILDGCGGAPLDVVVERDGEKVEMTIVPSQAEDGRYIIGFTPLLRTGLLAPEVEGYEKATVGETLVDSVYTMRYYVKSVVVGFVRLFTMQAEQNEVTGPIGIVQIMGDTVEEGLSYSILSAVRGLCNISALLSVNLGVINLFPIPAMDGGRLVFLFLEAIRRKPVNPNMEGLIHFAGFVLLMAFMVVVAYQDVARIFF